MTSNQITYHPFSRNRAIERDLLESIHPSLKGQLQLISFEQLTADCVRVIFDDRCETVLRDFVREMREKHLLP